MNVVDDQVIEMLKRADDGAITMEEFCAWLLSRSVLFESGPLYDLSVAFQQTPHTLHKELVRSALRRLAVGVSPDWLHSQSL